MCRVPLPIHTLNLFEYVFRLLNFPLLPSSPLSSSFLWPLSQAEQMPWLRCKLLTWMPKSCPKNDNKKWRWSRARCMICPYECLQDFHFILFFATDGRIIPILIIRLRVRDRIVWRFIFSSSDQRFWSYICEYKYNIIYNKSEPEGTTIFHGLRGSFNLQRNKTSELQKQNR